jgi:hypothetical protein
MLVAQNQVFLIAFSPGFVAIPCSYVTTKNARGTFFGHCEDGITFHVVIYCHPFIIV